MKKWFRRLAEVPGVGYEGSPGVDRTKLPGHDTVPKIDRYDYDVERREYMMWPMKDGSTSASPAKNWETKPRRGETEAQTALRQLRETLELPGTLSDYHFAIQHCHDELRVDAREEPWVLEEVEQLCWLDIRLIEKYPETITNEYGGDRTYFGVSAFHRLIEMYEREGFLRGALEVARIGQRFEQRQGQVEEFEIRIARIEAEANAA
jgi:hypothetical protein